jgi:hypothetical protein
METFTNTPIKNNNTKPYKKDIIVEENESNKIEDENNSFELGSSLNSKDLDYKLN